VKTTWAAIITGLIFACSLHPVLISAQPKPVTDSSMTRATFRFHEDNLSACHRVKGPEVHIEHATDRGESSLGIDLWQGECRFALSLCDQGAGPRTGPSNMGLVGDTVTLDSDRVKHRLYALSGMALEWEVVLDNPPDTNCFEFPLETSGLRFYHQPPLSDSEIALDCYRPDNVIGSWAAYHALRSGRHVTVGARGDTSLVEDYGCGKAFHIYRPKAWDSSGDTVWCKLHLEDDRLNLIMPQQFLDDAVYPVTIDPEIGFSGVGASYRTVLDYGQANVDPDYTYVATTGDRVTGFCAHTKVYSGTKTCEAAVYTMPGDSLNGGQRPDTAVFISISNTDYAWNSVTGLSQSLASGTRYAMALGNTSGTINISYDASVVPDNTSYAADNQSLMTTWVETGRADHRLSMYALVENTGGGDDETSRRRSLLTGER